MASRLTTLKHAHKQTLVVPLLKIRKIFIVQSLSFTFYDGVHVPQMQFILHMSNAVN